MKRIYLIDCPGVVPPSNTDTPQDILLRGVVRVENVENPEQYIPAVLSKTKPQHIERTYQIKGYKDHIEFLEKSWQEKVGGYYMVVSQMLMVLRRWC
jgi:nuclear GTP-binding protein